MKELEGAVDFNSLRDWIDELPLDPLTIMAAQRHATARQHELASINGRLRNIRGGILRAAQARGDEFPMRPPLAWVAISYWDAGGREMHYNYEIMLPEGSV